MSDAAPKNRNTAKLLLVATFLCVPLLGGLGAVIADNKGLIGGCILSGKRF
jgi:hypothetical protein